MKKILSLFLLFFAFTQVNAQKSKITIHNKNGFVSQTGFLVNGYKEGKWTNVNRRNDTSYSVYKKDKVIYREVKVTKPYGKFKGQTHFQTFTIHYNKSTISNSNISFYGDKIYSFEKSVTCPYYSKPYYKYYMIGDSRTIKTIIQQMDLSMTVYPLKDHFGTKYDRNLNKQLPHLSKLEFEIDPENGYRSLKDLSIYYNNKKIDQSQNNQTNEEGNRYELIHSDNYFFQEGSVILLKKNGALLFREEFYKGIPVSFTSFYENGNPKLSLTFKNGLPHGKYESHHENGEKKLFCFFEEGVLQGEFDYFEADKTIKFKAQFVDGQLDGVIQGKDRVLLYKNRVIQQSIVEGHYGEVIKWTSGYNSYTLNNNLEQVKMDGVNYTYDRVNKRYTQFSYHTGETHFRFTDYTTQDFILVNYNKDKDNWFSLYIKSNGEIKDDINVTVDGKNYRKESKKLKLKLIKNNFFNIKKLTYPDIMKIHEYQDGETTVKTTILPTGVKCLEERIVNGKFTGKRLMWGMKGNLMQETNYLNNHNEGKLVSYNADGEKIEEGLYKDGVKTGEWLKVERGIKYTYFHNNSNTAQTINSYYANGDLKSVFTKTDSGSFQASFNEDGTKKSEYFRNKKSKIHGSFLNTYGKGKTAKGYYLNGYMHGEFNYYNENGTLAESKYYDYGRIVTKRKTNTLNSNCACPQEFNVRSGSSYYPTLDDLINYKSFTSMFSDVFVLSEENYGKVFMKNLQTSHGNYNTTRFFGFDWIGLSKKNSFELAQFQGIELRLTPCKKTGEIADRNMTINYTHQLERYSGLFDEEVEDFEMTSKNMFALVLEISETDEEEFIRKNYREIEDLNGLFEYLNKNGFKLNITADYDSQIKHFYDYLDDTDKYDEFFNLIFLKDFNHGILDKKKNPNGYRSFETAMNTYFRHWNGYYNSIDKIKENIIDFDATMNIDGGRYAFTHPLITFKYKPTPLLFNCKSINVRKRIDFKEIKDICIQPNTIIQGTKLEILEVKGIAINAGNKSDKLIWNCIGKHKGVKSNLTFELIFGKDDLTIKIDTQTLSEGSIEKLTEELKGTYNPSQNSIVFQLKTQPIKVVNIKKL